MTALSGHSEFDRFLLTPLTESNGLPLTVLSMLARQDIDPIEEAARLSQLPNEAAINSLASKLWKTDNETWSPCEASLLAARLIALLPVDREPESPVVIAVRYEHQLMMWLVYGIVMGTLVFNSTGQRSSSTGEDRSAPKISSQELPQSGLIK